MAVSNRKGTSRLLIASPLLVSLLVPVWVQLSGLLGYDLLIAPDPMSPRYNAPLLSFVFYLVWWPLALIFVLPGTMLSFAFIRLFPDGELRFELPALIAGLVYSVLVWIVWCRPRRQS